MFQAIIRRLTTEAIDAKSSLVVCAWPVSSQYGPGIRFLFYCLVLLCVLAREHAWLQNACLASALIFLAVASLHAIVITSLHVDGAVDMDIYGILQQCSVAVLILLWSWASISTRNNSTNSHQREAEKGALVLTRARENTISIRRLSIELQNIFLLWKTLLLFGLVSLSIEFFRVTPSPCDGLVQREEFQYGLNSCGLTCSAADGPFNSLHTGQADEIGVIPIPHLLSFRQGGLFSVFCGILIAFSLVYHISRQCREQTTRDFTVQSRPSTLFDYHQKTSTRLDVFLIRFWTIGMAMLAILILYTIFLGEMNFWSAEVNFMTESLTSIGQLAPIAGAMLAILGAILLQIAQCIDLHTVEHPNRDQSDVRGPWLSIRDVIRRNMQFGLTWLLKTGRWFRTLFGALGMYFFAAVIATGTFVFGGLILVNCGSSRIATVTPYIEHSTRLTIKYLPLSGFLWSALMQHEKSPTDKPAMAALPSRRADGSEKEINAPGYNISSATLHEETSLKSTLDREPSPLSNRELHANQQIQDFPALREAIRMLRIRLDQYSDINPSQRCRVHEILTSLELARPSSVRLKSIYDCTVIERLQSAMEWYTHQQWDWWPLPAPRGLPNHKTAQLAWTCYCGEEHHDVLPRLFANIIQHDLISLIPSMTRPTDNDEAPSTPRQVHQSTIRQSFTSTQSSATGITLKPAHNTIGRDTPSQVQPAQRLVSHSLIAPVQFIFFCAYRNGQYNLAQINVRGMQDDAFFEQLRTEYQRIRRIWCRWFSIWVYSHCEFRRFENIEYLEHEPCSVEVPPNSHPRAKWYTFTPRPPEDCPIPPIGRREFRRRFYGCFKCGPWHNHQSSQCVHRCRPGRDKALQRIPKCDRALSEDGLDRETYWGLLAIERLSAFRITMYHVVCLSFPCAFWAAWLSITKHPADLQNASVPLLAVLGFLSVFWSLLGYSGSPISR